ncbi:MAG TPA: 2-oxoglutarate dehydrogenase complex dihydrolipoyllysine-residue succinyltransferase [Bacteroidales bacterium]|jgi:2-oxoglutarate dehydrogenase E2 component (dihydrolipoamide succinyltransferase)|nr:dihydrolipoyllysine-residue succinyltransferase [Bacteroidota bacterium]HJN06485.1 2-oxoglutarate dehydrogenase complex dihydrolipoyllysine-residue succinyltransferase [Bacteroidales bacterium]
MNVEIKVPSPGESITEVQIAAWLVANGDQVDENQDVVEIDSDKATLSIASGASGKISIKVEEGETIQVNSVVAEIDTSVKGKSTEKVPKVVDPRKEKGSSEPKKITSKEETQTVNKLNISPLARKMMDSNKISESDINEFMTHHRVGKKDIEHFIKKGGQSKIGSYRSTSTLWSGSRETKRTKISMLRKKLSQRLVAVKSETAMLTTFNEVNMTAIMSIRKKYKESFSIQHDVNLGFMSFFTKAVTEAMASFPQINSQIDGDEIINFDYVDVSIAISAPKGLVVPVLRNAEIMNLAQIEKEIKSLATKAHDNKLTLDEMQGGTFTITNGGVFGSMLSTPILNPPQSAILGMHNIIEKPIAVNGKVEIHPMMYLAMSYDHRIIDGRESVGFLVKVKEMLENPESMLFGSKDPIEVLLGI